MIDFNPVEDATYKYDQLPYEKRSYYMRKAHYLIHNGYMTGDVYALAEKIAETEEAAHAERAHSTDGSMPAIEKREEWSGPLGKDAT